VWPRIIKTKIRISAYAKQNILELINEMRKLKKHMKHYIVTYIFVLTALFTNAQIEPIPREIKDTFEYFTVVDTNVIKYQLPKAFKKPTYWEKADKDRASFGILSGREYPDTFELKDALTIIDTAKQYYQVRIAESWCIKNYTHAFPYLIGRLSDKRKVGLKNTADLIIPDRLGTGELKFYGHGFFVPEDLFTIAGRASWILNRLTGENFAVVQGNLTKQQAEKFKQEWIKYINGLK
jgi:hypothetical protein